MNKLTTAIKNFIQDEEGVTAIEYALIASLIAVVIIFAVTTTGTQIRTVFCTVVGALGGDEAACNAG